MDIFTYNIADLGDDERNVIERFVGKHLTENQKIVVHVLDVDSDVSGEHPRAAADYAILADLEDAEAALLAAAMTQRSPGRDVSL